MKNKTIILILISLVNLFQFYGQDCNTPRGFRVSQVSSNSISFIWEQMSDNPDSWQIEYGFQGYDHINGSGIINVETVAYTGGNAGDTHFTTITDLQASTNYDFYIRTQCQTIKGLITTDWSRIVTVTTADSSSPDECETPIFNSADATDTTITISWSNPNDVISGWDIEYGLSGFVLGEGTSVYINYNEGTSYTISNLISNTSYDFYIRTRCSANSSSDYSSVFQMSTTNNSTLCLITDPTNLQVNYETTYSVYVSWDYQYYPINSETMFEIICTRVESSVDNYIIKDETNELGITITGLSPATKYDFYVRTICKNNRDILEYGDWIGPVLGETLPYYSIPDSSINSNNISCGGSFNPDRMQEYVISGWVKEKHSQVVPHNFIFPIELLKGLYNHLINKVKQGETIPNGYDVFTINNGEFQELIPFINTYQPKIWHFCHDEESQSISFTFKRPLHNQNSLLTEDNCIEESSACCYNKIDYSILGDNVSISDIEITDISFPANTQTDPFIEIEINEQTYNDSACYYLNGFIDIEITSQLETYENSAIHIAFLYDDIVDTIGIFYPSGAIIDGWQRIEGYFSLPPNQNIEFLAIELINTHPNDYNYFDDIRIFPFNGNMKSFVYDAKTKKLMAELDENNYATFYEYDGEGGLIRVKKETEKGVFTIQETRSKNAK